MLVIEKVKALALKLNNPAAVLASVVTAKTLNVRGKDVVVLPHKLDEVRVLRNLGIEAPSPIMYYYNWPGRWTPYEHQKETAAFLTLNTRGLVLNEIGCVDANTEYLSPTGWRRIADYTSGAIAQYHPDTGRIDFVEDPEFVKLPCSEMIRIKTKYGLDQLLSPEHRVLYVSSTNKRMVKQAGEIYAAHTETKRGWKGRIVTTFTTLGGSGIPLTDAQLRLQIAVMADGRFGSGTKHCVIRVSKNRKIHRLRKTLIQAGVLWRERLSAGMTVFIFAAPMRDKSYGTWAWEATAAQLAIITDEVRFWDGSALKGSAANFYSNDKVSADFIQYAYASTGRTASLIADNHRANTNYVVHARSGPGLLYACGWGQGGKTDTMWREPSTDGFKYCFMVPSTFLVLRRNGCIFATGNTGKTDSALWAADYLMSIGKVKRVLIVSPLSTLERVWGDAVFTQLLNRKAVVLHGSAEYRSRLLKTKADFFIVNHDGFGIIAKEAVGMFDLVIVDEAAVLRNPSTNRYKTFKRWMDLNPTIRLWLMTGTPTPNEPTDAWALAKLVQSPFCTDSYTNFRQQVMYKQGMYRWLPRPDAINTVQHILQPSVRYSRDECLDLPDTVYSTRKVALTPEQQKYYSKMLKSFYVEAVAAGGTSITAVNEAVKLGKLVQIACGVAYDDNGNNVELDCAPRVKEVVNLIEQAGEKCIVFVPLTGTLEMLERELAKKFTVAVVNGGVSAAKRNIIFQSFQDDVEPHVLLAHPATMAHGLTLTAASTIIWYGPITSNEQYVQANGRVERIGKRHVSNVIHVEGTELEHKMYQRLKNKQTLQGLLLELIQQQTKG